VVLALWFFTLCLKPVKAAGSGTLEGVDGTAVAAVVATLAGMGNKRVRGELHSVITTGGLM